MARSRSVIRGAVAFLALGLVAMACGDSKSGSPTTTQAASAAATTTVAPVTTATPQKGGSITISTGLAAQIGLDPAVAVATGCCGGSEMAAIYDTLVRYNPATAKFEPRTAQSL